jgi:5-methylcytosine-specific restriction endonuclease McrA
MSPTRSIALAVLRGDGNECVYCGADDTVADLTIDHITPSSWFERGLAEGDRDDPQNLVTACSVCNSTKRDMDLTMYAGYLRRARGWTPAAVAALRRRVRAATHRPLSGSE